MTKQSIVDMLSGLQPEINRRFRACMKGFFGSYARGDQSAASDLDVLVDFDSEADLFDLVGLSNFLEEKFGRPVDVIPINSIRAELKSTILKEAVFL